MNVKLLLLWTVILYFALAMGACQAQDVPAVTNSATKPTQTGNNSIDAPADPTKAGQESTNPKDGAAMVWVPAATFQMGSPTKIKIQGFDNEHPQHAVSLSGYWMYKNLVTVAQYRTFCAATKRALPLWPGDILSWKGKTGWDDPALQLHPIVEVTWDDAQAYAAWAGVCLPTEAQWEYAARGPQENNYPWGGMATAGDPTNGWDETKCANENSSAVVGKSTWPVGSFPTGASWCKANDMAGNVLEWCLDWYGPYAAIPVSNPTGPATGILRVLRGSSWLNDLEFSCRSAVRSNNKHYSYINFDKAKAVDKDSNIGFRCASLSK